MGEGEIKRAQGHPGQNRVKEDEKGQNTAASKTQV